MSHRSKPNSAARRQWWHRHGQTVAILVIVAILLVAIGLLFWFMSDIRFRAR